MLRKLITIVFTLPLAIILIVLSVANRAPVDLTLDPFNPRSAALTFSVPLFLVVILALVVGVIIGGAATWLKQSKHRKRAREAVKSVKSVQAQADALKQDAKTSTPTMTPSGLPLLGNPSAS